MTSYHEDNRISWNAATEQHLKHRTNEVQFLREGGSALFPEEVELLGDVRGKTLIHLQCNAGQDTLSLVNQLGAVVAGVDISDTAIAHARRLAREAGIPATFHRADLLAWFETNTETFDVAFTSYGVLIWLADIAAWGRGVASVLKPGGRFVLVEFHPFVSMMNDDWRFAHNYGGGQPVQWEDGVGDYVGEAGGESTNTGEAVAAPLGSFTNPNPSYEFSWGVGEVVTALLEAGLRLTTLREYPYCNGFKPFRDMRELPGRRMIPPDDKPAHMPLMYGIVAEKPLE